MISKEAMRRCLGRVGLMAHAPKDPDVLGALTHELGELCGDDAAADQFTTDLIREYESWPGIKELHRFAYERDGERKYEEKKRLASVERDAHEADCPGYEMRIDETSRAVRIDYCCRYFYKSSGTNPYEPFEEVPCRRARQVSSQIDERALIQAELARLGWSTHEGDS